MRSLSLLASRVAARQGDKYVDHDVKIAGLSRLGGGAYGSAYKHESSGRVLKVSYSLDDGTMDYIATVARYCAKHGKPPHMAPMVYEFGQRGAYWFAVMEYAETGGLRQDYCEMRDAIWAIMQEAGGIRSRWIAGHSGMSRATSAEAASWDLHSGNYGKTADGRVVVFDPFVPSTRSVRPVPKRVQPKLQHGPSRGRWAH